MTKFLRVFRNIISFIALGVMILVSFLAGIGQSVDAGTFVISPFAHIIVFIVCLLLYIIGGLRKNNFPIIVALLIIMFMYMLMPFLMAGMFEQISWMFNDNAARGLAEILYLIMVLGGIGVLALYLLSHIFGFKLSLIINIFLIVLLAVSLTYFLLEFIGVIISLANNNGASWYDLFSPLLIVGGYAFIFVNFGVLEESTAKA